MQTQPGIQKARPQNTEYIDDEGAKHDTSLVNYDNLLCSRAADHRPTRNPHLLS